MSSRLPYVTFPFSSRSCVYTPHPQNPRLFPWLAASTKGLFLGSAGCWKTGNVLSSTLLSSPAGLCLSSCSPGRILVTALPPLHGGENWKQKEQRGDLWGGFDPTNSSHQSLQITSSELVGIFFFKCLNFRVLTAVKRQEKKTFCGLSTFSCWWFLLSSFGQGCTHGLVFSL